MTGRRVAPVVWEGSAMFEIALGFLIWIGGGVWIWRAAPYLKTPLTVLLLLLSFGITMLIGLARWLLEFATAAVLGSGELMLMLLLELMSWLCGVLPPAWQMGWKKCGERLANWAATCSKTLLWPEAEKSGDSADAEAKPEREEPEAHLSAYQWALKIMGLEGETDLTLPKLKQRYRQMMSVVHPDKQFPNHVFAQQVNDAVETIKRERGWR